MIHTGGELLLVVHELRNGVTADRHGCVVVGVCAQVVQICP